MGLAGSAMVSGAMGLGNAAAATGGRGFFTNPVIAANHPDPAVLRVGETFYLYSTSGRGRFPVLTSANMVDWTYVGSSMTGLAPWAQNGRHWAPEVIENNGQYLMYYCARKANSNDQAISVAVADRPLGNFVDLRTEPLVYQQAEGGSIDASPFRDADGSLWLAWKNDGNHIGVASYLYLQRLSDDGLTLVGEAQRILGRDQEWETYTIEGPSIVLVDGVYHLIYSAGEYWNESYGVGYATAPAITGPWTKPLDQPVLRANAEAAGPGHGMPIKVGERWWYVYHAWEPDSIGQPPGRLVWLSQMRFTDEGLKIDAPSRKPQIRPRA